MLVLVLMAVVGLVGWAIWAHDTRNMFAEYASAMRWSNVHATTIPPHLSDVACIQKFHLVTVISMGAILSG